MFTIAQAAQQLGVTTRALRHYDRVGLVCPQRDDANDYRLYSQADIGLLRVVVVLRRLGVPLEAIGVMLAHPSAQQIHATLTGAAAHAATRAGAHSAAHALLATIAASFDALGQGAPPGALNQAASAPAALAVLTRAIDAVLPTEELPALPRAEVRRRELPTETETTAMTTPTPAGPPAGRLADVRIVSIAPGTVASSHVIGPEPELRAWDAILAFAEQTQLLTRKPDTRMFGFNHPNPTSPTDTYGYERWITIPEDMDVTPPLTRTTMPGGTYAAHAISAGDFHEWAWLDHWVTTSEQWESAAHMDDAEHMFGTLEEHLNLPAHLQARSIDFAALQLDLLIPVRPRA